MSFPSSATRMEKLALASAIVALSIGLVFIPSALANVDQMSDADITEAVETQFVLQKGVPFDRLDVETENGVVTLSGSVVHLLAKERAADIARSVRGVMGVVNRIDVHPPERSDESVRADVTRALYRNPATRGHDVQLFVRDGVVTLTGTVESARDKHLVGLVAKGVAGAKRVDNDVTVQPAKKRAATEIEAEIEQTLLWDAIVDHALIAVDADDDGVVALAGFVGSAVEKARAIELARVAGVTRVVAEDLEIDPRAEREKLRGDKMVQRSDAEILTAVERTFDQDPRVRPFHPEVSVRDGIVTLRGSVNNLEAKRIAAEDALRVAGVWHVRNLLKVKPGEPVPDDETAENVREALRLDPYVQSRSIDISLHEGEVRLEGTVNSEFEKRRAESAASIAAGVVAVHNNISVSDPRPQKSDWAIREDIRQELAWSPFVDGDSVTVSVDDGVATLSGRVDTWLEWHAAYDNAFEGGATDVRNQLDVRYGPENRKPATNRETTSQ